MTTPREEERPQVDEEVREEVLLRIEGQKLKNVAQTSLPVWGCFGALVSMPVAIVLVLLSLELTRTEPEAYPVPVMLGLMGAGAVATVLYIRRMRRSVIVFDRHAVRWDFVSRSGTIPYARLRVRVRLDWKLEPSSVWLRDEQGNGFGWPRLLEPAGALPELRARVIPIVADQLQKRLDDGETVGFPDVPFRSKAQLACALVCTVAAIALTIKMVPANTIQEWDPETWLEVAGIPATLAAAWYFLRRGSRLGPGWEISKEGLRPLRGSEQELRPWHQLKPGTSDKYGIRLDEGRLRFSREGENALVLEELLRRKGLLEKAAA